MMIETSTLHIVGVMTFNTLTFMTLHIWEKHTWKRYTLKNEKNDMTLMTHTHTYTYIHAYDAYELRAKTLMRVVRKEMARRNVGIKWVKSAKSG